MNRKGFTVIELLVVSTVSALLMLSMFQTIVIQQRGFTVQAAATDARQTLSAGMDVLTNELREVSGLDGDVITINDDSIQVRSPKNFALICRVVPPVITVRTQGDRFIPGDSVFVFADNDPDLSSDDTWINGAISAVDTTATCGGVAAQALTMDANLAALAVVDSVRVGGPVRNYTRAGFGLTASSAGWFLSHWDSIGSTRIVGPLQQPGVGLEFVYRDEFGAVTAVPADVRQVTVTLRAERGALRPDGSQVGDSLITTIQLRN